MALSSMQTAIVLLHMPANQPITIVSFVDKSYAGSEYLDGIIHFNIDDTQPSFTDKDPFIHVLAVTMLYQHNSTECVQNCVTSHRISA